MRETRALAILKKLYPKAHFQTIGGCVNGGVLDVNGCYNGVESWIELKQHDKPKTNRGKIKPAITRGQPAWQFLRQQAGGKTFVGLMLGYEFYLLPGWCLSELKNGISQERLEQLKLPETSLFEVRPSGTRTPERPGIQNYSVPAPVERSS